MGVQKLQQKASALRAFSLEASKSMRDRNDRHAHTATMSLTNDTILKQAALVNIETLALEQRQYGNRTIEIIKNAPLVSSAEDLGRLPFGIELESRFQALPTFAGGNDPRTHLNVQVELPEKMAAAIQSIEQKLRAQSSFTGGEWQSALVNKPDRGTTLLKCRLNVAGHTLSNFRLGAKGPLQSQWPALERVLETNLRGAGARVCVQPAKVWKVQDKIGCTWRILQIDMIANEQQQIDHFA